MPPTDRDDPHEDARLLRRSAAGDRGALGRLYVRHVEALHAFVYFRVACDAALAEDAVQDTFLQALADVGAFDPTRGTLRTWLCGLARNVTRRHVRDSRRLQAPGAEDDVTALYAALVVEDAPLPEDVLVRREVKQAVAATVASLPAVYRDLLEDKYVLGATLEELAARTGTTVDAVKSQLARARRAFRDAFPEGRDGARPPAPPTTLDDEREHS